MDIIEEKYLILLADDGSIRCDIKLPEGDLGEEIKEKLASGLYVLKVTILFACGKKAVTALNTISEYFNYSVK